MKAKILNLLTEDARMSLAEIAKRVGATPEEVKAAILSLEDEGVIRGYKVILNESDLGISKVRALIEVKVTPRRDGGFDQVAQRIARYPEVTDLYLISGGFDLLLMVEGDSLQDIASFVSAKLSTIDGVISTSTGFMLKKYKESGRIMQNDEEYERLKVCP
ncbi:Lrp/AsnC family transcriptional regulator [uncultured Victivallis sp.]|uniref:Lrp/AsnC family transcriptional regulator n=1 Tax=uncultured Victivallis sp. TaxID=354118 RepID=UPI0025EB0B39|nr:Lrp/AsnC family transcriptional regulator [uncultured Victivallis sp.]